MHSWKKIVFNFRFAHLTTATQRQLSSVELHNDHDCRFLPYTQGRPNVLKLTTHIEGEREREREREIEKHREIMKKREKVREKWGENRGVAWG